MTPAPLTAAVAAAPALRASGIGAVPVARALDAAASALLAVFVVLIGFDLTQPAPYDLLAGHVILLWLARGIRLPRSAFVLVAFLLLLCLGVFLSLVPHLDRPDSVFWAVISLYLAITAMFFATVFSEDSERRVELALKAFLASCVATAAAGIMGYFDLFGTAAVFKAMGRAAGTFEDPNVFGSFLILGIVFVVRDLVTGAGRRLWLGFVLLPVLLAGVLLAFSRGSWIATLFAAVALLAMTFATAR
ncbi:MAG TPA: O-antigen ligase domain-containing protein, partial [Beijerinckiaceae bacterium]|nr:O-antigen ligase domain-containing protein [Beijerinckiaceae bacterium]